MMVLVFNFKSGNKLEIPLKKSLNATEFRQLLGILKRDTCLTDQNLIEGYHFIDQIELESVSLIEKKTKTRILKESKE